MYETIKSINDVLNGFIWGVPAMVCIIGVGLYLSIRTGFVQIRKFPYALKNTLGKIFEKKDVKEGALSPFQAVCTALAATIGTGNIAGVAGAIAIGGPGAVFWMWISALLGMCTKFCEVTLAVFYREKNDKGEYIGGPMYYIKNGLGKKWMWLAYAYAFLGACAVFGTGNATQVNTIVAAIDSAILNYGAVSEGSLKVLNLILGIVICFAVLLILFGGVKRIGSVSEKLVPFMALLYVLLALGLIVMNINKLPAVFSSIFMGAFNPQAVTGGIVGSMFTSMTKGVSRGIFSNEAGLGTGSIAHACADTDEPVKQGMFGIFEVFMDTIVVCSMTGLVVITTGFWNSGLPGATLTLTAFESGMGYIGRVLIAVSIFLFGLTTSTGWFTYYSVILKHWLGNRKKLLSVAEKVFIFGTPLWGMLVTILNVYSNGTPAQLWTICDFTTIVPTFFNVITLFALSGTFIKLLKDYKARYMGIGEVDPEMELFFEDKKRK